MIAPVSTNLSDNNVSTDTPDHTDVRGRFNQYTSGYWALALPALAARYVARFALNVLHQSDKIEEKTHTKGYAAAVGGWMMGITGYYSYRTYTDMKRMLSETVAWEFDKAPKDITFWDMKNSKNVIVNRTFHNFTKYNIRRAFVNSTFFASLLPFKPLNNPKIDSVDLGVGISGAYLVHDVFNRKMTFFEALQNFVDSKINHSESVGQVITDNDLMNLYAIHERDAVASDSLVASRMDTMAWKQDQVIFGRMAELMNKTYKNTANDEGANFTVPKLLYLLGHGLITRDNTEQSLAYIEVANKFGIPSVKKIQATVNSGVSFSAAAAPYMDTIKTPVNAQPARKFTEERANNYVERLTRQEQATGPEVRTV